MRSPARWLARHGGRCPPVAVSNSPSVCGLLGLSWLVGHSLVANSAAFLLRLLAYNADLSFHQQARQEARRRGTPPIDMGLQARQVRFYNGAGRLLRAGNRWILRLSTNRRVERLWTFYDIPPPAG